MLDNIEVFTQNSIRIKSEVGNIYVDPFQIKDNYHDADFVLITHQHYDHFSVDDIRKVIKDSTVMVVPASMEKDANVLAGEVKEIVKVEPGTTHEVKGLSIETVPAYNSLKPFHPKSAKWIGYILSAQGKRIYIAGDTDATKEAMQVKCDIAIVPIGGTYTMDVKRAAELINKIKPEYVIPVHYGSIVGKPSDAQSFAALVDDSVQVVEKIQYFE